jgi:HAD superfamily phosphatase (TIGR01668 family)
MLERFVPTEAVEQIGQIDLAALKALGIKVILLDLDNTLTPWRSLDIPEEIAAWLEAARREFRVCIVSNTSKMRRLAVLRERLGVEGIGFAQKPWGMPHTVRKLGVAPEETVLIGDQLLTDVFGGNLAGTRTILVKPVSSDEFVGTHLVRLVERLFLSLLRRRGLFRRPW